MALLDLILKNGGAIGARILGYQQQAKRDEVYMSQPAHKPKRTRVITSTGKVLVFDTTTDINPVFPSTVTSFPVEDGANKSDHVINGNATFSITAMVSDYSHTMNSEKGLMTQDEFYKELLDVRKQKKEVSLITPVDTYTDLIMTSVGFPRRSGDGVSLFIDLNFEQIRTAKSETTTVFVSPSNPTTNSKQSGDTAINSASTKKGGKKFVPFSESKESDVIDISTQARLKGYFVEAKKFDNL